MPLVTLSMRKSGLCFDCMKMRPMYSPMMPSMIMLTLPTKSTTEMMLVQPGSVLIRKIQGIEQHGEADHCPEDPQVHGQAQRNYGKAGERINGQSHQLAKRIFRLSSIAHVTVIEQRNLAKAHPADHAAR